MNVIPQYFTVVQAADALSISPQRVRVLLSRGRLQGWQQVSVGGRVTWCVHLSLYRRSGTVGRPRILKRRIAKQPGDGRKVTPAR